MISRSWPSAFAGVCAISLIGFAARAQEPAKTGVPAIALMDAADQVQWQNWTRELGWAVIAAEGGADKNIDLRLLSLGARIEEAIKSGAVDASRVYLAGRGDAASAVFYGVARMPDVWAAAVALGGSPKPAIDTGRMFTVNFTNVPLMWISSDDGKEWVAKLAAAKINIEWKPASSGANAASIFQWLASHKRNEFPMKIDCETLSPQFAHCYWIQLTKFDGAERNDVLASTRVPGSSSATLDLGGVGWRTDDPGPGLLVTFLPEKYSGPLKLNDRILALDGKPIADQKTFQAMLDKVTDESHAVVTVQRGKDRVRVETRYLVPRRDATISARVQAEYLPAEKTIQIISRTVTEMRVMIPAAWVPGSLYWNGLSLEEVKEPGCLALRMEKELLHAEKCK